MLIQKFLFKRILFACDPKKLLSCKMLLEDMQESFKNNGFETVFIKEAGELYPEKDLLVVVGGDGFLMHVLRSLQFPSIAVFGLNFGQVGFLMNPQSVVKNLPEIIKQGKFRTVELPIVSARVKDTESSVSEEFLAINDFVLERGSGQTIRLDLYIDDVLLNRYSGDGIIIATSTGSTAYTLAAGGPVVHPELHALVVTPLNAHRPVQFHSLQFPLVLPLGSKIVVEIKDPGLRPTCLAADGVRIANPEQVVVGSKGRSVFLLRTEDYTYAGDLVKKVIGTKSGTGQ